MALIYVLIVKILYRGLDTKCIVSASPNHLNSHIIKDREIFASSQPEKGSSKIIAAKTLRGGSVVIEFKTQPRGTWMAR